jgi:PIN domain nuclease of toxin-antitoxin system
MPNDRHAPAPLLIDTHYWIWLQLAIHDRLTTHNLDIIHQAAAANNLFLSVMSIWELGMLVSKGRINLHADRTQWVEEALTLPGLTLSPLTPAIALESSHLPGSFHGDPADRIIVATARALKARLLTSDKNIRAYARQRHILLA